MTTTKLTAPRRRPETIARARVSGVLERTRERPLTVVCAPAGYGKTTALAEWCERRDAAYAWISLREHDNDPRELCAHLLAALDRLRPAAAWAAEQALHGGSDLVETVIPLAATAVSEHAVADASVIVLDDYHVITETACDRLLAAFVDALPPSVCVVVASRTVPPLRLPRRRAAGTLAEVTATDLAFDGAEARQLLNGSLRLRLDSEQVVTINDRVEGWPAGLALVASSIRDDRDPDQLVETLVDSHGRVAEYLIEEVLDAQPPQLRDFLRRTSVLPRMNDALCTAVLDDPRARALLDEVRRSNLFVVAIDDDWIRYHALFADLLQRDLRRHDPGSAPELHRRASIWFEQQEMHEDAIEHATAAGDGERAARLLHDSWWQFVVERRYVTLRRMISSMPRERGMLGPFCDAADALCMSLQGGDLRRVAARLDALEQSRDAPGVAAIVDSMRISPYYGNVARAVADGWRVWESAADDPQMRARQAGKFATVLWFAGERELLRTAVAPYMGTIDRPALRSWELAALALSAADDHDLDAAERHARAAVELVERTGAESALESHLAYVALAETLRRRGRLDEAYDHAGRALRTTGKLPDSVYHALALVTRALLDLSSRNRRAARAHAVQARQIVEQYPDVGLLAERLAGVESELDSSRRHAVSDSEPTDAERRVLALLPTDLTRREIAVELQLSVATVKSHTWRLYRRLGVTTRDDAVAIARDRGLL